MTLYNMLSTVLSATTLGLEGVMISVEVDVAKRGFPTFTIVGLPNKAVEESKERVRTAIVNSGFTFPEAKIVVNLAPADIKKEGSLFDLPIALGILATTQVIPLESISEKLFLGELSLDGKIRGVNGTLPVILHGKKMGIKQIFIPLSNTNEGAMVSGIDVFSLSSLTDAISHLRNEIALSPIEKIDINSLTIQREYEYDLSHIKGQQSAKRALEIAAAGFHNIHLKGVPGAGKTMMAKALPSIMPRMDEDEVLEVTKLYSIAGMLGGDNIVTTRPFRSPHQSISGVGMIGGSSDLTPGEISLAHRGVLFLDEFPQFPRHLIESLRQPLEDGIVTITRASGTVTLPARFLLVAASNPCPCGMLGHPTKPCRCGVGLIQKYQKKISGPILDRIDMHIDVMPVEHEKLTDDSKDIESSSIVRDRVIRVNEIQKKRFFGLRIKSNAEMNSHQVKEFCQMSSDAEQLLKQAVAKMGLSARSYFKVIKVAKTIADLSLSDVIESSHIAESLQYRAKDF